jgi:superfamily II DNA/RNA helicase
MKAEDYVHRIGRTGRAGRNGVAITLAERMDVSMIRRIQQFTTQNIPVGVVEGLEPKTPEPKLFTARPESGSRFGGKKPFGKPSYGGGGGGGGFGGSSGGGYNKRPFAPRSGEGYSPRERAPFDRSTSSASGEAHTPHPDNATRSSPFDRTPGAGRTNHEHKPAGFTPRKPAMPSAKGGFKPPRTDGFSR